jgi:hypothetical protein
MFTIWTSKNKPCERINKGEMRNKRVYKLTYNLKVTIHALSVLNLDCPSAINIHSLPKKVAIMYGLFSDSRDLLSFHSVISQCFGFDM